MPVAASLSLSLSLPLSLLSFSDGTISTKESIESLVNIYTSEMENRIENKARTI